MAGHRPPKVQFQPLGHGWRELNVAPTEEQRLEQIKQAYVDGLVSVEKMEEDIQFVLEGGFFAGSYRNYVVGPPPPPPSRR